MKKEDIEKSIANLASKLKEKARDCNNMDELKKLIDEIDIELPEDVIEAMSGGCSVSDEYPKGHSMPYDCPECQSQLKYHDDVYKWEYLCAVNRVYCDNPDCKAFQERWLFAIVPVRDGRATTGYKLERDK